MSSSLTNIYSFNIILTTNHPPGSYRDNQSSHHHIISSSHHLITTLSHHLIITSSNHHIISSSHHHITTLSHQLIISSPTSRYRNYNLFFTNVLCYMRYIECKYIVELDVFVQNTSAEFKVKKLQTDVCCYQFSNIYCW